MVWLYLLAVFYRVLVHLIEQCIIVKNYKIQ